MQQKERVTIVYVSLPVDFRKSGSSNKNSKTYLAFCFSVRYSAMDLYDG